ncbi:hypothetical protein RugamoR57_37410 [Duganella caerulea]|uniref:hypothetical protein n=1 Tax=Duganella caerulea TaxID=2885762 RepID=UPI0030E7E864
MAENSQSTEAYKIWLAASEKYDYHVVGVAGALCAWAVQALTFKVLDWPAGVQLGGIAALVASVALGLLRIERTVHVHSLSLQGAKSAERLSKAMAQERENYALNSEFDKPLLESLKNNHLSLIQRAKDASRGAVKVYRFRNYAVVAGLTLYSVGRVWAQLTAPVIPVTIQVQLPASAVVAPIAPPALKSPAQSGALQPTRP